MNFWKWFSRIGIAMVIVVCIILYAASSDDTGYHSSSSPQPVDDSAYRNIH